MNPFGHIGITLFLATLFYIPALAAVVGVLLPDIIDKGLFILGYLPCGRSAGHNLFFGPILAAIGYAITRKKAVALALFFGAYLHILQDLKDFIPWLYPIVNYDFVCPPAAYHVDLYSITMEVIGIGLIIFVIFFKSKVIYIREKLFRLLRGVK